MKQFNTTGLCVPEKHYMVDLTGRVNEIIKMIEEGKYFVINRARQYGKTTTLFALEKALKDKYEVLSMDFQSLGNESFSNEYIFTDAFCRIIMNKTKYGLNIPDDIFKRINDVLEGNKIQLNGLFEIINDWCTISDKPIVLIIDEVDSASNNQVFLDFLAQLRYQYLEKEKYQEYKTFKSVILAGVNDIKHVRSKIRDNEQHKVNSPWNIAADFNVDMSFNALDIEGMLKEYEDDHHTGMNISNIAKAIYDYTSGYPFLVSRLCQLIDENNYTWDYRGFEEVIKIILNEKNALFDSITGKLENSKKLKESLKNVLMQGDRLTYSPDQEEISQLLAYGFLQEERNSIKIANRIFETRLYNLLLSDEELMNSKFYKEGELSKNIFIKNNELDMPLILEHFIDTFNQIYGPLEDRFKEKDGRELFLLYLKPIINGIGNYYIEAQTRNQTRTDVIVDYLGKQYVIELKIWRGPRYNEDGEKQLKEYLDYFNLNVGYMLSFNFNKNKTIGVNKVEVDGKIIYEGVV